MKSYSSVGAVTLFSLLLISSSAFASKSKTSRSLNAESSYGYGNSNVITPAFTPIVWQSVGETHIFASSSVNNGTSDITTLSTSGNGPCKADFFYSMPSEDHASGTVSGIARADFTGSLYLVKSGSSYLLDGNFHPIFSSNFTIDANELKKKHSDLVSGTEYYLAFKSSGMVDCDSGLFALDFGSSSSNTTSSTNPLQWARIGEAIDNASTSVNQNSKNMTTLSTSGNGPSQADFFYSMASDHHAQGTVSGISRPNYNGSIYLEESGSSYLLAQSFNPSASDNFTVDANQILKMFPSISSGDQYRLIFNSSWMQSSESGLFGLDFGSSGNGSSYGGSGNGGSGNGSGNGGSGNGGNGGNGDGGSGSSGNGDGGSGSSGNGDGGSGSSGNGDGGNGSSGNGDGGSGSSGNGDGGNGGSGSSGNGDGGSGSGNGTSGNGDGGSGSGIGDIGNSSPSTSASSFFLFALISSILVLC